MLWRVWDFHNKYKAEITIISSVVDDGNDNCFHGDKPRPNIRNAFGVNAALETVYACHRAVSLSFPKKAIK